MRITVVDLDWYNKLSFIPNPKCMKISSYHKQQGDLIVFPKDRFGIKAEYDKMYVIKDNERSTIPPELKLTQPNVILIGESFKYYDKGNKELNLIITSCVPDYTLYPLLSSNKFNKANFVQFFFKDKRIEKKQDYHNGYNKVHRTVVLDKNFWKYSIEDLKICCNEMKSDSEISFKYPIDIKDIIQNEEKTKLFLILKYSRDIEFSNHSMNVDRLKIIKFLLLFRQKMKFVPRIPMHSITVEHNSDPSLAIKDFEQDLQLLDIAKSNKLRIYMIAPSRHMTPFWFYFEEIEAWCIYQFNKSFIEHMLFLIMWRNKMWDITDVLMSRLKWNTLQSDWLVRLVTKYPKIIDKYGYREWGEKYLPKYNLTEIIGDNNFESIYRFRNDGIKSKLGSDTGNSGSIGRR